MSYRKYVNWLWYVAKSHNANVCKTSKELYFNIWIRNCKKIAKILWYSSWGQVMTIKKYVFADNCERCWKRIRNPKNYIVWY